MDRYLLQNKTGQPIPVKTIYAVRHGQSTHNARAFQDQGAGPDDARYVDAALTSEGEMQAESLRDRVQQLAPELIVASPLTRAIQTALLATERVRPQTAVVINPLCRELLLHSSDVGNTVTTLQHRFPQLDFSDVRPAESWWWSSNRAGERLSAQQTVQMFGAQPGKRYGEPSEQLIARVNEFKRWLLERPEKKIMFFSHGIFLQHFIADGEFFHNAELRQVKM